MKDRATTRDQETFFRSIPNEEYDKIDGNVDGPSGWFGLVEVDEDLRTNLTWNRPEFQPKIDFGWYLVQIDSNGRVYAFQTMDCESDPVGLRHGLEENFREMQREYSIWLDISLFIDY